MHLYAPPPLSFSKPFPSGYVRPPWITSAFIILFPTKKPDSAFLSKGRNEIKGQKDRLKKPEILWNIGTAAFRQICVICKSYASQWKSSESQCKLFASHVQFSASYVQVIAQPLKTENLFSLVSDSFSNHQTCTKKAGIRSGCCNPSYWEARVWGWLVDGSPPGGQLVPTVVAENM